MDIVLIDAALSYGSEKRGGELAFDKLIEAGLYDLVNKNHKLTKVERIFSPHRSAETIYDDHPQLKYLNTVIEVNKKIKSAVYNSLQSSNLPIIIGGDHSLAIGSIAGASKHYNKLAVIWIDAHADMNTTQTSISHNIHGMPLAVALNYGEKSLREIFSEGTTLLPQDIFHIGARDVELQEQQFADNLKIDLYDNEMIKKFGLKKKIVEILKHIKSENYDGVHLSFDIDVLDASLVVGTGTPVNDGLSLNMVKETLNTILESNLITSIDFVEYNPLLDDEKESTKQISLELIETILDSIN